MTGVQTCALRSEEHTSELQSHDNLVCRLLLEKKKHERADPPTHRPDECLPLPPPDTPGAGPRGPLASAPEDVCVVRRAHHGVVVFFFNDPAPPEISTLSLPEALPI